MEELTDFLTNKWFTTLNQALLWQKSKYQMFAPPVLWILCVHQSSLQTLKAITWQILCLLKLWENSAHLGSLFFIGKICVLLITFLDFLGMLLTPVDPADRTKREQMQNHHPIIFIHPSSQTTKDFLEKKHLYIIFICRKNILECSPRYIYICV